jgi:hypothetical protein
MQFAAKKAYISQKKLDRVNFLGKGKKLEEIKEVVRGHDSDSSDVIFHPLSSRIILGITSFGKGYITKIRWQLRWTTSICTIF